MQLYEMVTDDTLRSMAPSGTPAFPFASYFDEISQFRGGCVAWHWHQAFEFSLALNGPVDCQIGTERLTLATGDGLFLNSGAIHRFASDGGGTLQDVLFAPEFLAPAHTSIYQRCVWPVLRSGVRFRVLRRGSPEDGRILDKVREVYRQAQAEDDLKELRVHISVCALWELFYPAVQGLLSAAETPSDRLARARLHRMLDFIRREYHRTVTLADIAASASVSKSEALRCFRGIQTTPGRYLTEYRLERARERLCTTADTVAAVAMGTGFQSPGYFCRVFKARFGVTPEQFRKMNLRR